MVRFDAPINADDASFKRVVLEAPFPVLAVFWSAQDASRRRLSSTLTQTARRYTGEVLVVKLDIADSKRAQLRYSVRGVPQFLLFKQGALLARVQGVPTAEMLRPWIEYLLGRGEKPTSNRAIPVPEPATAKPVSAPPPPAEEPAPTQAETKPPPDKKRPAEKRPKPTPVPPAAPPPAEEPAPTPKKKRKRRAKTRRPAPEPPPPTKPQSPEQALAEGRPLPVDDADFDAVVLDAKVPVLAYFWARGVAACERVQPTVKTIAWEFAGRVLVVQMDVDKNPEIPKEYGGQVAPTLIIFHKGHSTEGATDSRSARSLRGKLEALVAS
ncbi:MAG: hypothetical protein E3J64_07225 [Anaerolineales bacterium]|nr:MAG: hypothetical protein E3J64_07225 [Anaerolineales bacterium]